ncbi:MAG: apolipoprotein N-acyltransferase, partial [Pseudomonadota bacterium]
MLGSLRDRVVLLHGWRANLLALTAGAITALGLAPFHIWPIVFVTFPLLVWLLDGAVPLARRDGRRPGVLARVWPAFQTGWWFGFGYFLAGLWWIGRAFLVEADTFLWLLPIAVVALPAGLALFWGLACSLARAAWIDIGWRAPLRLFALAAALGGAEWLRGTVLTGFPWNLVGYVAMPSPVAMQSAALIGAYGVTALTVLAACLPALLAERRAAWIALPGLALLVGGHIGYGIWTLGQASDETVDGVQLRIVQPAIAQDEKWIGDNEDAIMARYLEGSNANTGPRSASVAAFTHIIWPESAFPFILTQRPDRLAEIGALLPEGTQLITGGMRVEDAVGEGEPRVFNALYLLDDRGTIRSAADKTRLVPFGEYLPARDWLSALGLRRLVPGNGGFVPGNRRAAMRVPGAPALL